MTKYFDSTGFYWKFQSPWSPLHSSYFSLFIYLFEFRYPLTRAVRWVIYCPGLTILLLILYCSSSFVPLRSHPALRIFCLSFLVLNRKHTHTHSERQWIEMWLLSASKRSINTLAFLKPWQSHCYKLTRLSNFPSWNKSFLMYFF